jgi:lipopolysaccharide export system permease protein
MLFHSSIRKELARSFGATLVVLVTIVMTMTIIRTLGEASRGTFNPSDVMIIMGDFVPQPFYRRTQCVDAHVSRQ